MSRTLHRVGEPIPEGWYALRPLPHARLGEAEFGQDVESFMDGGTLVIRALAPVSEHNPPLRLTGWENCFIELRVPLRILDSDGRVLAFIRGG